jgi:hypothetical protein
MVHGRPIEYLYKRGAPVRDATGSYCPTSTLIPVPNSNPLRTGVSVTYPPLTIRKNYESAVARGSTPRFGIFQNHLLSSRPVNFFCFSFWIYFCQSCCYYLVDGFYMAVWLGYIFVILILSRIYLCFTARRDEQKLKNVTCGGHSEAS